MSTNNLDAAFQKEVGGTALSELLIAMEMAYQDRALHLLLIIFLGLALIWNWITPVFETPDEPAKVQYVLFMLEKGHRPDLQTEVDEAGLEAPQPPLYFFILSLGLRMSGLPHQFPDPVPNPDFSWTLSDSTPNAFLPIGDPHYYIHFLRGFSAIFGLLTVICTYLASALLRADRHLRLAATSVTAFLPQFTFLSGAVENDTLTTALASIGFVWLLQLLYSRSPRTINSMIYGGICGLAFLSKYHAIFLLPLGLIMFPLVKNGSWRDLLRKGIWSILGFLAVAGWLVIDNVWKYGDPTGLKVQMMIVAPIVAHKSLLDPYFLSDFPKFLFKSFLGVFGWMKLYLPDIIYWVYGALWAASFCGVCYAFLQRKWPSIRSVLVLAPILVLMMIVFVNLNFTQPQGRYLFPALTALSLLFTFGLAELPSSYGQSFLIAAPLFLLATNIYSILLVYSRFPRP